MGAISGSGSAVLTLSTRRVLSITHNAMPSFVECAASRRTPALTKTVTPRPLSSIVETRDERFG